MSFVCHCRYTHPYPSMSHRVPRSLISFSCLIISKENIDRESPRCRLYFLRRLNIVFSSFCSLTMLAIPSASASRIFSPRRRRRHRRRRRRRRRRGKSVSISSSFLVFLLVSYSHSFTFPCLRSNHRTRHRNHPGSSSSSSSSHMVHADQSKVVVGRKDAYVTIQRVEHRDMLSYFSV